MPGVHPLQLNGNMSLGVHKRIFPFGPYNDETFEPDQEHLLAVVMVMPAENMQVLRKRLQRASVVLKHLPFPLHYGLQPLYGRNML